MAARIEKFSDLDAWQVSFVLAKDVYKLCGQLPASEAYGLSSQMKRAAVSIASNIAEGFSRQSAKEKIQFYHVARGSLTELENQLLISVGIGYLEESQTTSTIENIQREHKLINGLIRSLRTPNTKYDIPNTEQQ